MTQTLWETEKIAKKIAFINCRHKPRPCLNCIGQIKRQLRTVDLKMLHVIVIYFEPKTKWENITPLTWNNALYLTQQIHKVLN